MLRTDTLCRLSCWIDVGVFWRPRARDPADDWVLETALNGHADHLVTLNTRDFAAAAPFRLAVVEPRALLHQLREEPA